MEKMRDKNGNPEKKSSRTTLIMAAGLLGILLIGIAPMLKTDGAKNNFSRRQFPRQKNMPPRWKAAWRESWGALTG